MGISTSKYSFCTDENRKLFKSAISRQNNSHNNYRNDVDYYFIKKYSTECPKNAIEQRQSLFSENEKKPLQTKKKYMGIVVYGLGCETIDDNLEFISKYLKALTNIPIEVMCDKSEIISVGATIAATYCKITPWKLDKFVKEVYKVVKKNIDNGYNVILIGHSYGGSVVSRVAEIFNDDEPTITRSNLEVATMGSIYIPKANNVKNIKIKHYMYTYDVALKCNGVENNNDKRITWIESKLSKPKFSFLGTEEQWKVHLNYEDLIVTLLKNNNINNMKGGTNSLASRHRIRTKTVKNTCQKNLNRKIIK